MRLFTGHIKALREVVTLLYRNRELTYEMARREIFDRYSGQWLGAYWAIGHPLFLMGLYVFIFAVVFKQSFGGTQALPRDYITYLLCGLVPWLGLQEAMVKNCSAISSSAALVKQMVFPIESLPAKGVASSLATQFVGMAILILYVLVRYQSLPWTYALLPVVIALQVGIMLGTGFLLSAIGVFVRDTKDVVQVLAIAGVYLLPVFYLPDNVPALFRSALYLNPFSHLIWCYQDILYYGRFDHPWSWVVTTIFSALGLSMGYRLFRLMKPSFGNVL
jgi:lipopolysaccharide transport system permease protein